MKVCVSIEGLIERDVQDLAVAVMVDGRVVPWCIFADEVEGTAECVMHDRTGRPLIFRDNTDERTCIYSGRVEVVSASPEKRARLEQLFGSAE